MALELCVKEERKLVEIWLTNAEQRDASIRKDLETLCVGYGRDYTVAVFLSGEQDLMECSGALLRSHRQRKAEEEVQNGKMK